MDIKVNHIEISMDFIPKNIYAEYSSEEREAIQNQIVENFFTDIQDKNNEEIIKYCATKVPDAPFISLLQGIKELLEMEVQVLESNSELQNFMESHPVSVRIESYLTPKTRRYSLAINKIKEYISEQQKEIDSLLLGPGLKKRLLKTFSICPITGEVFNKDRIFLEYGIKDGRLPVPVSLKGHEIVELEKKSKNQPLHSIEIYRDSISKKFTWRQLYNGALIELGFKIIVSREIEARKIAKRVHSATGISYHDILDWLKETNKV